MVSCCGMSNLLSPSVDPAPGAGFYRRTRTDGMRREVVAMPFREGEVFRCPQADCGCELTVTKAGPPACTGQRDAPTCCCGQTMVKTSQ